MRVKLGTKDLTSLMILGFAAAPKDSSFTLNIVFSCAFSYNNASMRDEEQDSKHEHTAAGSSAAAAAAVAGTAEAVGRAIS
jgi:hypothetical protein